MKNLLLVSLAMIFFWSCNDDDVDSTSTLNLEFQNLPDLGNDYVYEGWLAVNGGVESAGRFSVNSAGNIIDGNFSFPAELVAASTAYILTIEPADETGAELQAPSDVHILAGDFSGNSASLTIGDTRAIGNELINISGNYILATPTTESNTDELAGVWFIDLNAGPGPGLDLPSLPSGWRYEGWAVQNGMPYSTGTFSSVNTADNSSDFSGPMAGPPFPGEDFVQGRTNFPLNLQGGTIVVSVEPYPDNSPDPFIIKPLIGQVPVDALDHFVYSMNVNQNEIPFGTVFR